MQKDDNPNASPSKFSAFSRSFGLDHFEQKYREFPHADGYYINGHEVNGSEFSARLEASYLKEELDEGPYTIVATGLEPVHRPKIRPYRVVNVTDRRPTFRDHVDLVNHNVEALRLYNGQGRAISGNSSYLFPDDMSSMKVLIPAPSNWKSVVS